MTLGEIIVDARMKKCMVQTELAVAVGVTKSTIVRIEKNQRKPRMKTLARIATILDLNYQDLIKYL